MSLSALRAYISLMRLNKPVGIWLVFYPCAWAVALASPHAPDAPLLGLMLLGAVLMRSAGCVLNDMADRKIDAHVTRSASRPLVTGALSVKQALVCAALLLLAALGLCFLLPHPPLMLALMVAPLVALYPFMKRFTWWPQLFLGLVFNTSVLFGWLQASGSLPLEAFILYAACVFWTLGYDTIYALQDVKDDVKIGVKSTARRFGKQAHLLIACSYAATTALMATLIVRQNVGDMAALAVIIMAVHLVWQWRMVRSFEGEHAGRLFASNATLGLIIFLLFVADRYTLA